MSTPSTKIRWALAESVVTTLPPAGEPDRGRSLGAARALTLDANADVVVVDGNESLGRYVEFKDAQTGRTVGHRVFAEPTTKP